MTDPTQLKAKMGELGAQFLQRTAGEVAKLKELLERLRNGDTGAFKEIEYFGHRICGTGATLGFEPISEHAGRIERLAEGRTTLDAETLRQLEEDLAQLEQAVAAALKS